MKKAVLEVLMISIISIFIILSSFAISRHLGYISLIIPYGIYLFYINKFWLLNRLSNKQILLNEYFLLNLILSIVGFLPFAALMRIASGYNIWIIVLIGALMVIQVIPLTYFYFIIRKERASNTGLEIELEKKNSELQLLTAQVNPHFLFNTLNTIYYFALREKADLTADSILRLSEIMRYMTLVNNGEKVFLSQEISFLKSYLLLQKERFTNANNIRNEVEIGKIDGEALIFPMLLIPILENAYKFGISNLNDSWVKISLQYLESTLELNVSNSRHLKEETSKNGLGTGLDNLMKRLNLLYPGNHQISSWSDTDQYHLLLKIKLF